MFKFFVLLVFSAACGVFCNDISGCNQKAVRSSFLDAAIDMIAKAKEYTPICNNGAETRMPKAMDCADVLQMGQNKSGIYEIWPINRVTEGKSLRVYCDMDTDGGGWTVIQRRGDFKRPKDYFYKDWKSYKEGFGDIDKDFWLGNDNIYALTNQKLYSVRFDLMDVKQKKQFALYEKFWIEDENQKYMLRISNYSGTAMNAMWTHNNRNFTTRDQDNDNFIVNCAHLFKGGWWYNACHLANLNGLYHKGYHASDSDGVNWHQEHDSLEWTEIKIRPKYFKLTQGSESTPM